MPKTTKNDPNMDLLNTETNLSIMADHYGLTPKFMTYYSDSLKRIEDKVKKSLKNIDDNDPKRILNTMQQLQNLTVKSFGSDNYGTSIEDPIATGVNHMTSNGFRMIYGENENKDDAELFNFHASIFSNYRNLVSEYRNIGRLIPEVHRCADMKSRDILSINEVTKRAISNVYIPPTTSLEDKDPVDLKKDPINKDITERVLDRYEVEDKLPRYFMTALIEGAKPVVVYPFQDILAMVKLTEKNYSTDFKDFNMRTSKSNSVESFSDIMFDYHKRSSTIIPSIRDNKFKIFSTENGNEIINQKNLGDFRDMVINKFCSKEDLNEYFACGVEDIRENIDKAKNDEILSIAGNTTDIDKSIKISDVNEKFRTLQDKVKVDGALTEHFKNQIYNAAATIDANVEFYDESEAPMAVSINTFRRLMQFHAYHEDPKSGVIAYNAEKQKKYERPDATIDSDPISRIDDSKFKSVLDDEEISSTFNENTEALTKDCLIKEYDAEDVIPVIVSGKHVGYYVIETSPYTGNVESVNKRNCNFTDMFINLGLDNDSSLSPSPASSGTFGGGLQSIPMSGVGPISDSPTLGVTGAGSMSLAGGLDICGYDVGPTGSNAIHRNNIMKKIMFNVLKQKLKNRDINDNETFTDTILSLIRDGAIVNNRVKIIYIPEKYMCYFTPGLDGNGIPQSFLKDCLFTCYEKILVNMNNIMTRLTRTGTRDKVTVNVGKAKNMGATIRSIENALTTRRLNVESPFTSLSRVLKAASLSETIIVPVFDGGEKLFEYEDLTKTNQVDPDDNLEEKLTNQIVTALKCPITITNPYQEEDFASIAASRNAEYRFDIIKNQKIFGKTSEKFIKLLIVGSGLYSEIKTGNKDFNLKDIHVLLNPPENLNMKNANDIYGTVSSYVDNILNVVVDPDDDTEIMKKLRFNFKKKLYQRLAPGLNLDEYIDMADKLKRGGLNDAIQKRVNNSVNEQINATDFKALVANPDGSVSEAENQGAGNADSAGW